MKCHRKKGRQPAALQSKNNYANRHSAEGQEEAQRSPDNWWLDAATFWVDGDKREAIGAAMQGLCRARASYGRG